MGIFRGNPFLPISGNTKIFLMHGRLKCAYGRRDHDVEIAVYETGMFAGEGDFPIETEVVAYEYLRTHAQGGGELLVMAVPNTDDPCIGFVFDLLSLYLKNAEVSHPVVSERMSASRDPEASVGQPVFYMAQQGSVCHGLPCGCGFRRVNGEQLFPSDERRAAMGE